MTARRSWCAVGRTTRNSCTPTDDVVAQLDERQFTLDEGPCLLAIRLRAPVMVSDLGGAEAFTTWPGFVHGATRDGALAAFAFPLQVGSAPFGTVELYRGGPGGLSGRDTAIALLIVDDLVRVVLDDLTGHDYRRTPARRTPFRCSGGPRSRWQPA